MKKKDLPIGYKPSVKDAQWFLDYWMQLPNYSNQENALEKLFNDLCPENNTIEDVLIKCSSLNDFYSTNIFDIHTIAQHILSLRIDGRLKQGDLSLVDDISHVEKGNIAHTFYSFATKYCSHHQPLKFAIYDSYVEKVLVSLNKRDGFSSFKNDELRIYSVFMKAIEDFRQYYGLMRFDIKQIDQYLWQLGKWYFNQYGLSYKYYNREDKNPYPSDDIRSRFWYGEMMFVKNIVGNNKEGEWKLEGKELLLSANDQTKQFASKFTPEQFGMILYINELYARQNPFDDFSWTEMYQAI